MKANFIQVVEKTKCTKCDNAINSNEWTVEFETVSQTENSWSAVGHQKCPKCGEFDGIEYINKLKPILI